MKIAVLSGKGGTGKTLVSVNLAYTINNSAYLDCDVEEPNGELFFKGDYQVANVEVDIPLIDHDKCILCGKCSDFCRFNALALIIDKVRVFPQLCHSCGGCKIVCPVGAISEKKKIVGVIKELDYQGHKIITGEMNIKEESGVKIIEKIIEKSKEIKNHVIIDCPPGNGCSVMASIRESDYCVLVAEPTVFGLHNLQMVYELSKVFNKKTGIVINKASGNQIINTYALDNKIEILAEIPFDKKLSYSNSMGEIITKDEKYFSVFEQLSKKIIGDNI